MNQVLVSPREHTMHQNLTPPLVRGMQAAAQFAEHLRPTKVAKRGHGLNQTMINWIIDKFKLECKRQYTSCAQNDNVGQSPFLQYY